jgi:omega-amidase
MTVDIALAQISPVWEDPEATLVKSTPYITEAAEKGADIICFPEQFATGWDPGSGRNAETSDGYIVTWLADAAKENNIAILGSLRLKDGRHLYNASFVIGPGGNLIAWYKKIHLFSLLGEEKCFRPGGDIAIFSIGDMTFGLAICYDLRFSSLFHIYAGAGVDGVFVPAAWPYARMDAWELFIRSHALEDQMYCTGINTTGTTPVDQYSGGSLVADPYGRIISRAGSGEGLTYSRLSGDVIERARHAIPVTSDKKTGLYHDLYRKWKKIP